LQFLAPLLAPLPSLLAPLWRRSAAALPARSLAPVPRSAIPGAGPIRRS